MNKGFSDFGRFSARRQLFPKGISNVFSLSSVKTTLVQLEVYNDFGHFKYSYGTVQNEGREGKKKSKLCIQLIHLANISLTFQCSQNYLHQHVTGWTGL